MMIIGTPTLQTASSIGVLATSTRVGAFLDVGVVEVGAGFLGRVTVKHARGAARHTNLNIIITVIKVLQSHSVSHSG